MEIKDLMIGDSVFAPNGEIVKIIAIDGDGDGLVEVEYKDFTRAFIVGNLTPIPFSLTSLLHNGFILIGAERGCYHYCDKRGNMFVDYCKEDDFLYIDVPNPIEILYAHQFQHLLRIYGLYDLADNIKIIE